MQRKAPLAELAQSAMVPLAAVAAALEPALVAADRPQQHRYMHIHQGQIRHIRCNRFAQSRNHTEPDPYMLY